MSSDPVAGPETGPGVGAIAVVIDQGRVLVVKRGKPPNRGSWAFPGGKIEFAEPVLKAALRELREETGITARALRWLDPFDAIGGDHHYVLVALLCDQPQGTVQAGDDAADARWVTLAELEALPTSDGVVDYARALL